MTLANLKTLCTHHDLVQRAILVTCIQESSPWNVIRAGDFLSDQAKHFFNKPNQPVVEHSSTVDSGLMSVSGKQTCA